MKTKKSVLIVAGLLIPALAPAQDGANTSAATPAAENSGATGTVVFFREKKMMGAAIRFKV